MAKVRNLHKVAFNAIINHDAERSRVTMTKTLARFYASRIAAGAMWLHLTDKDWYADIDVATLDLFDCDRCVLGQVVGDYRACVDTENHQLNVDPVVITHGREEADRLVEKAELSGMHISYQVATALGFHLDNELDSYTRSYEHLTAGWAGVISYLQARRTRVSEKQERALVDA